MNTVHVQDDASPFDVHIGYGLLSSLGDALAQRHKPCRVLMVSDAAVHDLYGKSVEASLAHAGFRTLPFIIPAEEGEKKLSAVAGLLEFAGSSQLAREDMFLSLGGALTADIAGMAAALYLHGISYVRALTTLRGAVEGATSRRPSLNLDHGRNLVGVHHPPLLTVCDCDTFASLSRDIYQDGVAECLRNGMMYDRALFQLVARGSLDEDCLAIVARCIEIRAENVDKIEQSLEGGKLMGLGQTMARAVQALSGYTISHGHAISIGMVGATRVAETLGVCTEGNAGILMAMLDRLGLPSETGFDADALARTAVSERLRHGDDMAIILPTTIGRYVMHPFRVKDLPRLLRLAKGERA